MSYPKGNDFVTIAKCDQESLGKLDLDLLAFLSNNARGSLIEIARATGASVITVRYHLKKLIAGKVITGFRAILDINLLGREYYKVDLFLNRFENSGKIRRRILSSPDVVYSERTIISGDIEFDLEVRNFEGFMAFMNSLLAEFPGEIRDYSYYSRVKSFKTSYMPSV